MNPEDWSMDLRLYALCQSAVYSGLLNHYTLNRYLCCALQLLEWITLVNCSACMQCEHKAVDSR